MIIGSVMAGSGNLFHPATPLDDDFGVARVIAESHIWVSVHLVIVFGIILLFGGLVGLHRSIRGWLAGALARFSLAAAVVGVAVGGTVVNLDGVAAPVMAKEVTFILFGLAVARSDVFARWLGWVAGVASIGAGRIQAFAGESTVASRILTIIGPSVITTWLLVIGYLQIRLAGRARLLSPRMT